MARKGEDSCMVMHEDARGPFVSILDTMRCPDSGRDEKI
jgi:hypothetical protein